MQQFNLDGHDYITLNNLLKVEGWVESGARAKMVIAEGLVTVDGEIELRKTCKIRDGQSIHFDNNHIKVVA